jgi:mono/diheme cytochrome c family protein
MPVFFLKSILSIGTLILTLFAMYTMFEVFGRAEKKYNIETLKKLHRANGALYILFFLVISYLCLGFLLNTKAELSARSAFHSVFALTVILLLSVKVAFVRVYRQFYGQAKTLGLLIALVTFGMLGTSAGYYLLVTKFGTDIPLKGAATPANITGVGMALKTDNASIMKGKELYDAKCSFCHDPLSNKTIVGPGHKGILKNPYLPVSGRPATPENIRNQIKTPYKDMPAFSYLSGEQALDIISYMNTF